jgi:SOS-response transcriptional repressor LexA
MINEQDIIFRKMLKNEAGITLVPCNENYEPVFYSNKQITDLNIKILGIPRELRREIK